MTDWYSEQFRLRGRSADERRRVYLWHLALIVLVDVLFIGGSALLFEESVALATVAAVIFTVMDLVFLAIEAAVYLWFDEGPNS